jgi:hypothetical protein
MAPYVRRFVSVFSIEGLVQNLQRHARQRTGAFELAGGDFRNARHLVQRFSQALV